jgi:hypothetical protein
MGAMHRVGKGLLYRPARPHKLTGDSLESIPGILKSFRIPSLHGLAADYLRRGEVGCGRAVALVRPGDGLPLLEGNTGPAHPLAAALRDHVGQGAGPLVT